MDPRPATPPSVRAAAAAGLLALLACGPGPGRLPERPPPYEPWPTPDAAPAGEGRDAASSAGAWPPAPADAGTAAPRDAELPHLELVDAAADARGADASGGAAPGADAGARGPDAAVTPDDAHLFPPGLPGALQGALDAARAGQGAVGAGLGVRVLGTGTWTGASGGGLPSGPALGPDDLFLAGSITQSFTAALALKLVEQGALGLDQPIAAWYPSLPGAQAITVRHLLAHTSGLADYFDDPRLDPGRAAPHESLLGWPALQGLRFAPGTAHALSSTNYVLLGLILEQVTGASYRAQLRVLLLAPLGLARTYLNGEEPIPNGFAPGLAFDGRAFRLAPATHPSLTWAAGGVVTSMGDLLRWFDALASGRVLGQASLAAMTTGVPINGTSGYYGLGLMGVQTPRGLFFFADGALDATSAVVGYLYAHQTVLVAWTNTQGANPYALAESAALTLFP